MNFELIYDLLFAVAGLYVFSLYGRVSMSRDLNDIRMLLPRKLDLRRCRDANAFLARIKPMILLFGASVLLTGVVGALEDFGVVRNHVVYLAALGLCIAMAAALVVKLKKTVKLFWDLKEEEKTPRRSRRK